MKRFVVRQAPSLLTRRRARRAKARLALHTPLVDAPRSRVGFVLAVTVASAVAAVVLGALRRRRASATPVAPYVPPAHAPVGSAEPTSAPAPDMPAADDPAPAGAAAEAAEVGGDDAALAARVQQALFAGETALGVSIEARSGVITLRGKVHDPEDALRFVADAEAVDGVRAVQDDLERAAP